MDLIVSLLLLSLGALGLVVGVGFLLGTEPSNVVAGRSLNLSTAKKLPKPIFIASLLVIAAGVLLTPLFNGEKLIMDTLTFALLLIGILLVAFLTAWYAMRHERITNETKLQEMELELRPAERAHWLDVQQAQSRQIQALAAVFSDAKELEFEATKDRVVFKMSRRESYAPLPPQYVQPTIIAPQPLYEGGATRGHVVTGRPDQVVIIDGRSNCKIKE